MSRLSLSHLEKSAMSKRFKPSDSLRLPMVQSL